MNKSESKYFNTAKKMDQAFIEILEKKDFEYISVKEICKKAEVNRSTFYLHYENMGDLLEESINYMNNTFLEYFHNEETFIASKINDLSLDDLYLITPKFLVPYLKYIKEHQRLFFTAIKKKQIFQLNDTYNRMFKYILSPIMDKFSIKEEEKKYLSIFYMNGILGVIEVWINNGYIEDIDYIVDIICRQVKRGSI